MQTYQAIHADVPLYLRHFTHITDIHSRQKYTTDNLFVPAVRLSTVGRRAFPVTGACIWNDLPSHITSSPSLLTFRQRLTMNLFCRSYPGLTF